MDKPNQSHSNVRQHARTEHAVELPKYWSVRYQDWLSLDEIEYLKMQEECQR